MSGGRRRTGSARWRPKRWLPASRSGRSLRTRGRRRGADLSSQLSLCQRFKGGSRMLRGASERRVGWLAAAALPAHTRRRSWASLRWRSAPSSAPLRGRRPYSACRRRRRRRRLRRRPVRMAGPRRRLVAAAAAARRRRPPRAGAAGGGPAAAAERRRRCWWWRRCRRRREQSGGILSPPRPLPPPLASPRAAADSCRRRRRRAAAGPARCRRGGAKRSPRAAQLPLQRWAEEGRKRELFSSGCCVCAGRDAGGATVGIVFSSCEEEINSGATASERGLGMLRRTLLRDEVSRLPNG